jgi:predicted glutamine amidotransferase
MCRFVAYIGSPIVLNGLLFKPKNSLINQSIHAHESDEPLNGDGFGIGWYMPNLDPDPGVFVSVRPAWNERNLRYIAPKIQSDCILAHVRAASQGDVTEFNCHPFHHGKYLFMHNGDIEDFMKIRRALLDGLSNEAFEEIGGQTDTEHLFAVFMDELKKSNLTNPSPEEMANALEQSIHYVQELKVKYNASPDSYINAVVTNGDVLVAVRYVSSPELVASTLYYASGGEYECEGDACRMRQDDTTKAVLVVSEKLTSYHHEWTEIPVNNILTVDRNFMPKLRVVERKVK